MDIGRIVDFFYSKFFWRVCVLLPILIGVGIYLRMQYVEYFMPSEQLPYYKIKPRAEEDTVRVIIVGDSWAEFHANLEGDTIFEIESKKMTDIPMRSWTRGKGGSLSKQIYYFMYDSLTVENPFEQDRCTQPLIESHPDYCALYAGINDVIFKRSYHYYTENLKHMIRMLLHHGIRPIVMQIPMVDAASAIDYKPFLKRSPYHIRAFILGTEYNTIPDYREAQMKMLKETGLIDSVLFIPAARWDTIGGWDDRIYTYDRVHLNMRGYHVLDSCLASEVLKDWKKRQKISARQKANGPGKD